MYIRVKNEQLGSNHTTWIILFEVYVVELEICSISFRRKINKDESSIGAVKNEKVKRWQILNQNCRNKDSNK